MFSSSFIVSGCLFHYNVSWCVALDSCYVKHSPLPRLQCLFPFPGREVFSYDVFSYILIPLSLSLLLWGPLYYSENMCQLNGIGYLKLSSAFSLQMQGFSCIWLPWKPDSYIQKLKSQKVIKGHPGIGGDYEKRNQN